MRIRGKLLLALIAALALAAAVGTASARRFEITSQGIRAVWREFRLEEVSLTFRTVCPVTLEGSFHSRIISKVSGQLVGYITAAITGKEGCGPEGESLWLSNGDGAAVNTLPWHIRYDSFAGTLPTISSIVLQIVGLGVKFVGSTCEMKSSATLPAGLRLNLNAGKIQTVEWISAKKIMRINGPCGTEGILAGTGSLTVQGATTAVSVRLVQ
jgi:hypothetical protein